MSLNVGHALTDVEHMLTEAILLRARCRILFESQTEVFKEPCLPFKRYQKCIYKSSHAMYLLAFLTNVIVETNSVGPDQQQSILGLHCLT